MNDVLITAAKNADAFIARTLESVAAQTPLLECWIERVRQPVRTKRTVAGNAHTVNASLERMRGIELGGVAISTGTWHSNLTAHGRSLIAFRGPDTFHLTAEREP